jgi:hypothetical protein
MPIFPPYLNKTLSTKTSSLYYSSPKIPMQPILPTIITPGSGPFHKLAWITSALFLNTTQVATVKAGPSVILTIDKDIKEYYYKLKLIIDPQKEV